MRHKTTSAGDLYVIAKLNQIRLRPKTLVRVAQNKTVLPHSYAKISGDLDITCSL